jgi:hypothetical protein
MILETNPKSRIFIVLQFIYILARCVLYPSYLTISYVPVSNFVNVNLLCADDL